jgi:hypothetical protein
MINLTLDKRNGFLMYETTPKDIALAHEIFNRDFKTTNTVNNKTVYARDESRIAGILGEIVFGDYLGDKGEYVGRGNVTYDFIVNDSKRVDVKCKYRTVPPKPEFEASFFVYQGAPHFKDVDYYAFLSTITGYRYVWFCGLASKQDWLNNPKGRLWKAGEVDNTNGKRFDADTWSVFYRDLEQFTEKPLTHFG